MQTITMRGTGETFNIEDQVYPTIEMGIVYIRMVVVDLFEDPTHFMVAAPQDILYRLMTYDQKTMDDIIHKSDEAMQQHMDMMETPIDDDDECHESHDRFYG